MYPIFSPASASTRRHTSSSAMLSGTQRHKTPSAVEHVLLRLRVRGASKRGRRFEQHEQHVHDEAHVQPVAKGLAGLDGKAAPDPCRPERRGRSSVLQPSLERVLHVGDAMRTEWSQYASRESTDIVDTPPGTNLLGRSTGTAAAAAGADDPGAEDAVAGAEDAGGAASGNVGCDEDAACVSVALACSTEAGLSATKTTNERQSWQTRGGCITRSMNRRSAMHTGQKRR